MSAAAVGQRSAAAALKALGKYGYSRSGTSAVLEDNLLRAVVAVPAPQYSREVVTLDVSYQLGLPGLSRLDGHGLTWAFEMTRVGIDGDRAVRRYEDGGDEGALVGQLLEDFELGRQYLEQWSSPDHVLRQAASGTRVSGLSRPKELAIAAGWAVILKDDRVTTFKEALRAESVSDRFLQEHLSAVDELTTSP